MARIKRNQSPERQSLYGYKNKYINNSRNGYSKKTIHTSYGDMDNVLYYNSIFIYLNSHS